MRGLQHTCSIQLAHSAIRIKQTHLPFNLANRLYRSIQATLQSRLITMTRSQPQLCAKAKHDSLLPMNSRQILIRLRSSGQPRAKQRTDSQRQAKVLATGGAEGAVAQGPD